MNLWFNIKKNKSASFEVTVDFHNHVIPEIDDGCKDIEQSVRTIDAFEQLGITQVIAYPYMYWALHLHN